MPDSPKHLLVDGQNVIHAWPELAKLARRDINAARAALAQRLSALHDALGLQVTIVFDGRARRTSIEQVAGAATFTIIHTSAAVTADDVIEQLVGKSPDPKSCLVATSDRMERQTVEALGASTLPPSDLSSWALQADSRLASQLPKTLRSLNGEARVRHLRKSNDPTP